MEGVSPGRYDRPKRWIRAAVPLWCRKRLARLIGRQQWLSGRFWWVQELLRDFEAADPNSYHRFLWSHHLGYAETYEVGLRFGRDRVHPTRLLLFDELSACLKGLGKGPDTIDSVFEVGCSLGYNLRFLEEEVFRQATVLEGCDIDAHAIEEGSAYLGECGSRVRLSVGDMADLDTRLSGRTFDITLCPGVLMYLSSEDASRVVASTLRHTRVVACFSGLADPHQDNATLGESAVRGYDGTFIHNIDDMVQRAGGKVQRRRWEGARLEEGNTIYFVFAVPDPERVDEKGEAR